MHNYWIGIMALAFVVAMTAWLLLVFNADRHGTGKPQESSPQREVIGGEFEAREGGRQLMPHPALPSEPAVTSEPAAASEPSEPAAASEPSEPAAASDQQRDAARAPGQVGTGPGEPPEVPGQRAPVVAGPEAAQVPEQGKAEMPEHAPARGDNRP